MAFTSRLTEFAAAAAGVVEPHHATIRKAASFAVIGLFNTGVDFGLFAIGYRYFGLTLVVANIVSWMIAVSGSYALNSMTTFAAESGRRLQLKAYGVFVLSGVAGLIANTTTLVVLSYVMPVLIAKLVAIGVSFVVNFSLSHFVVFRGKQSGG
jgi:putative flippase GtrA